jgi:signal transduction histidine kinase
MPASVRFRVTAVAAIVVVAVLVVTGFALVAAQRRLLTESIDDLLRERADVVAAGAARADGPAGLASVPMSVPSDEDLLTQIFGAGGRVVAAGPGAPAVALAPPPPAGRTETLGDVHGPNGDRRAFRVLSRRVPVRDGVVVVHVAASLDDVQDSSRALVVTLLVAVPAAALVLGGLTWALVGRTLRPVEAIRAEVAGIGGGDLDRRVPVPPGDDEVARLARTMNAMLDRVEQTGERQRRFVADASHELRGPLTRMRTELEVDIAHPDGADPAVTARSVLQEVVILHRLVDDLLALARGDAGASVARPEPVDLDDVVMEHAVRLRAAGTVSVDAGGVSAAQVSGDRAQLARAVGNLVDNAARHASGTVTLALAELDGTAVLSVTDDGPGIPPAERERVFERFTRLDPSRAAGDGTGAGLGLAIARDIAARHGGTLTVDPGHGPGARLVLVLPVRPV